MTNSLHAWLKKMKGSRIQLLLINGFLTRGILNKFTDGMLFLTNAQLLFPNGTLAGGLVSGKFNLCTKNIIAWGLSGRESAPFSGCDQVIVVTQGNLNGFTIAGTFSFVAGPGTPPLGNGSLQITAPLTMLLKDAALTTPLVDLTVFSFSMYEAAGDCIFAASIPIDTTGTGTVANDSLTFFGGLSSSGVWTTFNFLTSPLVDSSFNSTTFTNYVANYPNARLFLGSNASILFSIVGMGCILNFDKLTIGRRVNGINRNICYDFEPAS